MHHCVQRIFPGNITQSHKTPLSKILKQKKKYKFELNEKVSGKKIQIEYKGLPQNKLFNRKYKGRK